MDGIGNDKVIVSLPYPVKFLGLKLTRKRNIGFSFTNLSMYLFFDSHKLKNSSDLKKWQELNGQESHLSEVLYFAAVAYCQLERTVHNFTKEGLITAILLADETEREKLKKCAELSETFGVKKKPQARGRIR